MTKDEEGRRPDREPTRGEEGRRPDREPTRGEEGRRPDRELTKGDQTAGVVDSLTPSSEPPGRKLPLVAAEAVVLNHDGFGWRDFLVRLPEGAIADDLKEPSIWSAVQGKARSALRRHDRVYCVAFDESWAAEAIVTDATAESAALSRPRIVGFTQRTRPFARTETHEVAWFGNGYAVRRRKDGRRVTEVTQSEAVAERELMGLAPRKVG